MHAFRELQEQLNEALHIPVLLVLSYLVSSFLFFLAYF